MAWFTTLYRYEISMAQHYRQLVAWQKAMQLVTSVYETTRRFPREEIYGLTPQIRRAVVSVPSNIAEGQGRRTRGEFQQFLGNAYGSLLELETQVIISQNVGYLDDAACAALLDDSAEVGRIINGLIASLTTDH
jgi:four helix bundle protein